MKKLLLFISSLFVAFALMAQYNVTFTVYVSGVNADTTDLYISGDFAGWAEPGSDPAYMMTADNDTTYSITVEFPDGENQANFKFFQVYNETPSWTYGEWDGDPNRFAVFVGESTFTYTYAVQPVWVTFEVDMMYAPEFSPDTADIYIAGNIANGWAQPGTIEFYKLDAAKDGMYTKSMLVYPTDDAQYKYFFVNNGMASWDYGEWTGDPNRMAVIDTAMTIMDYFGTMENISEQNIDAIEAIFPNPCTDYVTISLKTEINQVNTITVHNILGELIYSIEDVAIQGEVKINTSNLVNGIYFVTVINDQGYQAARFIKK